MYKCVVLLCRIETSENAIASFIDSNNMLFPLNILSISINSSSFSTSVLRPLVAPTGWQFLLLGV